MRQGMVIVSDSLKHSAKAVEQAVVDCGTTNNMCEGCPDEILCVTLYQRRMSFEDSTCKSCGSTVARVANCPVCGAVMVFAKGKNKLSEDEK